MGDDTGVEAATVNDHSGSGDHRKEVDIYPLSCYYFGSKEAIVFKDETLSDRINRMKSKYFTTSLFFPCKIKFSSFLFAKIFLCLTLNFFPSYAAYGLRTSVEAVILVGSFSLLSFWIDFNLSLFF